ncbi:MAG TPA: DEAD/DEAH box helicase, partial [Pyrodictium sp.]|nr:DEAD/DEAH box helicase [Pyrodictium sp.]
MGFETVLEISPIRVESGSTRIRFCNRTLKLRRFQEEVVEVFRESIRGRREHSGFLLSLEAPTGAGKTLTLLAPLIAAVLEDMSPGHGSIGVYPARELAWDQFESIASLLERLGCREEKLEGIGGSEYVRAYSVRLGDGDARRKLVLAYVTSESIEKLLDACGGTSKREALEKLADLLVFGRFQGEPSIVFTVPEYPYLLLEAAYRDFHSAGYWISEVARCFSKALSDSGFSRDAFIECVWSSGALRRSDAREYLRLYTSLVGDTIFFDEFHAYDSLSLPAFQALAVAALAEHRGKARIVISSATPQDKNIELVKKIAEKLGYKVYTIRAKWPSKGDHGDVVRRSTRLVIHYYVPTRSGAVAYYEAQRKVVDEAPRIVKNLLEKARKVVVFVDRVSNVYAVAEK